MPGCLAVSYKAAKADYMNKDVKAFRLDDVEWMIYKDEKSGMAYFYNSVTKGVQWSDPRPVPAWNWADAWHIIAACAFIPPTIFMAVLGIRVWYIKVCPLTMDCSTAVTSQLQQGPGGQVPAVIEENACPTVLCCIATCRGVCSPHQHAPEVAHATSCRIVQHVLQHVRPPPPSPHPPGGTTSHTCITKPPNTT
jgi:hypothetical protein